MHNLNALHKSVCVFMILFMILTAIKQRFPEKNSSRKDFIIAFFPSERICLTDKFTYFTLHHFCLRPSEKFKGKNRWNISETFRLTKYT